MGKVYNVVDRKRARLTRRWMTFRLDCQHERTKNCCRSTIVNVSVKKCVEIYHWRWKAHTDRSTEAVTLFDGL